MVFQELYHGTMGDSILAIAREGLIRPTNGEIYFGKHESQYEGVLATPWGDYPRAKGHFA